MDDIAQKTVNCVHLHLQSHQGSVSRNSLVTFILGDTGVTFRAQKVVSCLLCLHSRSKFQ